MSVLLVKNLARVRRAGTRANQLRGADDGRQGRVVNPGPTFSGRAVLISEFLRPGRFHIKTLGQGVACDQLVCQNPHRRFSRLT